MQCGPSRICADARIPPTVAVTANPTSGPAPLEVTFEATVEPGYTDGCREHALPATDLTWDLDGDGVIDEAGLDTTEVVTTYDDPGEYVVTTRVSSPSTGTATPAEVTITVE